MGSSEEIDRFVSLRGATESLGHELPCDPNKARGYVVGAIRTNDVRIKDARGRVLRWRETDEYRQLEAGQAHRAAMAGRYNPFNRRRRAAGAIGDAKPQRSIEEMLWEANYQVHVVDLGKVLAREFKVHLSPARLADAAIRKQTQPQGPIEALVDFFKLSGMAPENKGLPKALWRKKAHAERLRFTNEEFEAARLIAVEKKYVTRLVGAPKKGQRSKNLKG